MLRTYTNPVYPGDFPDPFVLRFNGRYYAYATGFAEDGRAFRMLSSEDLVHWNAEGGALPRLELEGAELYWAPEVAYADGRFYMYYATGRDADPDHHLRVAVAEHPLGPWTDAGLNLTPSEIFAIDAHPFRDPVDGQWYLFYARDRLEEPFAGTGLAVDRLVAMDRLEGAPRDVLRPFAAWQVFELKRAVKKGLDWYTVEGPFVVREGGRYVCFYSGGRWENPNYGVGFAVADHPLGPWVEETGREGPPVLTTLPDHVIGPGHNSVVIGPDLVTQYVVYHGWDPACTARYPRIDALGWRGGVPYASGPTWEPMPAPRLPSVLGYFDEGSGAWSFRAGEALVSLSDADLRLPPPAGDFVLETSVRGSGAGSRVTVGPLDIGIDESTFGAGAASAPLPAGFRPDAWHRLLIRREQDRITAVLDDYPSVETEAAEGPLVVLGAANGSVGHLAVTVFSWTWDDRAGEAEAPDAAAADSTAPVVDYT
jgi:GH43 family beta-xylosidase